MLRPIISVRMNSRAFNLFTALVSFLLIMLAVQLVSTMIQTERKASDTIAGIESRSNLAAVTEMARADAMQVFNYSLRKKIEDWLTDPARGELTLKLENASWNDIKNDFARTKFGGTESEAFANFTANALVGIFYNDTPFGNYVISLEGRETLKPSLQSAVQKSMDDFFTVIGCDNGDPKNCPKGTFYVNLHLERLSQEEYENLPRLHVIDKATGEELKQGILPRTTFRIYVPLRFFKAIAETRAIAHYPVDDSKTNTAEDYGLFSPRIHNMIEEIGLGICDYGYCEPRTNPFTPPKNRSKSDKFCPGNNKAQGYEQGIQTQIECPSDWAGCPAGYNANNNDGSADMEAKTALVAKAAVCKTIGDARAAGYIDAHADDDFALVGNTTACANGLAYDVEIGANTNDSATVVIDKGDGEQISGYTGGLSGYPFSQCPRDNGFGLPQPLRLGFYREGGEIKSPSISVVSLGCSGAYGDAVCVGCSAQCSQVKSVKVTLAFKEENPLYMVTKPTAPGSHDKVFKISIYDNYYTPFTGAYSQGQMQSDCTYGGPQSPTNCSLSKGAGWYCASMYQGESFGSNATTLTGCKPE
ncbi:MAG: hypothetical protein NTW59_02085 [Candidatus Diapherotrites archaeon]|nr:hypothetical protein [Candidatus Diapherotrites archaeon]